MRRHEYSKAELGMLLGIVVGGACATIMFAITSSPLWYGAVGIGVALGLGLGAALDQTTGPQRSRAHQKDAMWMSRAVDGSDPTAPTTNVRRVQDGQMTSLAASSASTNGLVRLRPASLQGDAPDSP